MDSLSLLAGMFRHMAWADAMVLSTITGKPEAGSDVFILAKLRHLHMVQKVFLDVLNGVPFNPGGWPMVSMPMLLRFLLVKFMQV